MKKDRKSDHDVIKDNTSLDNSSLHVYGGSTSPRDIQKKS
jgi:hypothetical protein